MTRPVLALLTLAAIACGSDPINTKLGANGLRVDLIGHVEGCRVYRLNDNGARIVYAVLCGDERSPVSATVRTNHSQSCGKGCLRDVEDMAEVKK